MNCTFVDCNKITIGDNVLIASNVQLYTATHPVELSERLTPNWNMDTGQYFCRTYALPIKIGYVMFKIVAVFYITFNQAIPRLFSLL